MNKSNRFNAILKDTTVNTIKNVNIINSNNSNNFQTNRINNNNNNNSNNFQTNRFVSKLVNEERNKKMQTENFIKSLDNLTDFPELQIKKHDLNNLNDNKNKQNYLDIIKINYMTKNEEKITHDDDDDEKNIPPGCVCIKYDKKTKQLAWIYGENTYNIYKHVNNNNDENDSFNSIQRVVDLYNNRKNNHINKWGTDEYDKMFLFQNYDYNYFDKLDEKHNFI